MGVWRWWWLWWEICDTNAEFHTRIVEMTGNELLRMHMKSLAGRVPWLFAHTPDQDPRIQCAEHLALCKAIYDGRPNLAAALALSHIEMGRKPSLEALKGVLPPK
ncbi:FCD domain-containing protein [Paeniglutamicibacter antarcticus]|uniref:FCD domain-containing protein n=1 Tax=Arthrobacter terrae TaxID=2935737 RepID=A0A931CR83_9MICC|nr:FCD domain-containing protein [Arthrobacter terrae]MBG0741542.1 FCD domain-containing protein [Arthrobacter terrae]